MNDEQLEDLKQFIDSRISQSEVRFDDKLSTEVSALRNEISALRQEMLDGFAGVGDSFDEIHKLLEEQKQNFDTRLTKLEQQAA